MSQAAQAWGQNQLMLPVDYSVSNDVIKTGQLHVLVCFSNSQIVNLNVIKTITVNMGSDAGSGGTAYTLQSISAGTPATTSAQHLSFHNKCKDWD